MKLYVKIPSIEVFRGLEKLLPYKDSSIRNKLNWNSENYPEIIDYKMNFFGGEFLKSYFDKSPFIKNVNGIYFGSETCENLIPTIDEVVEVYEFCQKEHINFVLVFPPIIEMMYKVKELLVYAKDKDIELVINDFGVLGLVKKLKLANNLILGRLLLKRQKNPLMNLYDPSLDTVSFYNSELQIEEFREFLDNYSLKRVSTDGNYSFESESIEEKEYYKDYYFPYTYLSMASKCPISYPCKKECRNISIDYTTYNKNKGIFGKNNGFYFFSTDFTLSQDFIKKRRNRLVWELWI